MSPTDLLSSADAAKVLDLTPGAVRLMRQRGELTATARTRGGIFLYLPAEVERARRERAERQTSRGASGRRSGGGR